MTVCKIRPVLDPSLLFWRYRIGHTPFEMRGQTITGNHVKPDPGYQHYTACPSLLSHIGEQFKHVNLTSDIQIVRANPHTGLCHGPCSSGKGSCTIEHYRHVDKVVGEGFRIVQRKRAKRKAVSLGSWRDFFYRASRDNGFVPLPSGQIDNEFPGIAVSAVNQKLFCHLRVPIKTRPRGRKAITNASPGDNNEVPTKTP